jgi:hypothetical protein
MGVPTAITDVLDMAPLYKQNDLGLLIPLDPAKAAALIRSAAGDESRLTDWSRRGREYALKYFHPAAVARNHLELYRRVIAGQTAQLDDGRAAPIAPEAQLEAAAVVDAAREPVQSK